MKNKWTFGHCLRQSLLNLRAWNIWIPHSSNIAVFTHGSVKAWNDRWFLKKEGSTVTDSENGIIPDFLT